MKYSLVRMLFFLILNTQVNCLEFNFNEFTAAKESQLIRQSSYVVLGALQMTLSFGGDSIANQTSRALYMKPFKLWSKHKQANFNTTFVFRICNQTNQGGEGLTFVLTTELTAPQNSSGMWLCLMNERSNLTVGGGFLEQFVAVEFGIRKNQPDDLDGNHVGLNLNNMSLVVQESLTSRGIMISSMKDITAHVRYDGKNLSVYVSKSLDVYQQRNLVFSRAIDLSVHLHETVYVGLTASTSNYTQLNCLKSWSFVLEIIEDRNMLLPE